MNSNLKEFRKVYNRKILRNYIKNKVKTNKISNIWHKLRGKSYYSKIDKSKI